MGHYTNEHRLLTSTAGDEHSCSCCAPPECWGGISVMELPCALTAKTSQEKAFFFPLFLYFFWGGRKKAHTGRAWVLPHDNHCCCQTGALTLLSPFLPNIGMKTRNGKLRAKKPTHHGANISIQNPTTAHLPPTLLLWHPTEDALPLPRSSTEQSSASHSRKGPPPKPGSGSVGA